jgi:hypothetical protein
VVTTASVFVKQGKQHEGDDAVVPNNMDALEWLRKHLEEDGSDVLREMVKTFAETLMAAEADAICGAGYGERSPGRVTKRNGYRSRDFDTRAGTIDLATPQAASGQLLPGLVVAATATGGAGADAGDLPVLRRGCVDAPGR